MTGLTLTKDGRTIFYQEGDGVYSVAMGGTPMGDSSSGPRPACGRGGIGGGGRGGLLRASLGSATGGGGSSGKKVTFTAKVKVDKPAEWAEMLGDAWRTMKYRFYDPKLHGVDWDARPAGQVCPAGRVRGRHPRADGMLSTR